MVALDTSNRAARSSSLGSLSPSSSAPPARSWRSSVRTTSTRLWRATSRSSQPAENGFNLRGHARSSRHLAVEDRAADGESPCARAIEEIDLIAGDDRPGSDDRPVARLDHGPGQLL